MVESRMNHIRRKEVLHARIELLSVFALVVVVRVFFAVYTRLTYEDALITMRYAQNLAAGHGFVYNIGERVLGTTTPLFTLLLALGVKCGMNVVIFAKVLGIAADGASGILIYSLVRRWGGGIRAAWYGVVLFGIWGVVVRVSVSGMETSLVVMLMLSALYTLLDGREWLAGVLAGLLLWTRVDAVCWLGVVFVWYCIYSRKLPWRALLSSAVVVVPWLVFATVYFGSPLPHSIAAKMVAYELNAGMTISRTASDMFGAFLGNRMSEIILRGLPLLLYFSGCVIVARRHPKLLVLAVFPIVYLSALLVMKVYMFDWYYVPAMVPYLIVAGIGANELNGVLQIGRLPRSLMRSSGPVIVLLLCGLYLVHHAVAMREFQRAEELHFKAPGVWLKTHTPADATVQLEPIGYIGYYSGRYVLDEIGLVSPQVVAYRRLHADLFREVPAFAPLAEHFRPDYMVVRSAQLQPAFDGLNGFERWFKRSYVQEAAFTADSISPETQNDVLVVFKRVSTGR